MLFGKNKPLKDTAECRYCKNAVKNGEAYLCRRRGEVAASDVCRHYKFDPFAQRAPRRRNIDTSTFDPLDFEI